jgi:double-stranded uracil-DNA glycosylase
MILQDLIKPNLDIIFCGTAVGNTSADEKLYYAKSGNEFYSILFKIGLTQKKINPSEYKTLLYYNIGLTDIAKDVSGNDNQLNDEDFNRENFIEKIKKFNPKFVCFNGKKAAAVFLYNNPKKTKQVSYGLLNNTIGTTKLFVAPSTSGNAKKYWDENIWFSLKNEINNG